MPCVIDTHAMLGHAGLDDLPDRRRRAPGARGEAGPWPCRPGRRHRSGGRAHPRHSEPLRTSHDRRCPRALLAEPGLLLARPSRPMRRRMRVDAVNLVSRYEDYRAATAGEEVVSVVFGGKARLTGVWIDDDDVAAYVARDPVRMIGFMSLDPTQAGWEDEMREGHERLGLRRDQAAADVRRLLPPGRAARSRSGATPRSTACRCCCIRARPSSPRPRSTAPCRVTSIAVAIRFPDVKIILAHLGHPYEGETVAVIRKHANRLRRRERPALSALAALPQPDARPRVRRLGQAALRHRLSRDDRDRDHRAGSGACATCRSTASPCRGNKSRGSSIGMLLGLLGLPDPRRAIPTEARGA